MAELGRLGTATLTAFMLLGACGGNITTGPAPTLDASTLKGCTKDSDCGVGEIDHEIYSRSDCMCLYGCPFIPLNTSTIERRKSQYASLCDPHTNGSGSPCGIDDCIVPPAPVCVAGECRLAADASR